MNWEKARFGRLRRGEEGEEEEREDDADWSPRYRKEKKLREEERWANLRRVRKPGDYDEDDSADDSEEEEEDDDADSELSRVRRLTGEDGEGDDEEEGGEDDRWRDSGRDEDLIRCSHRCRSPWKKDRPLEWW